MYSLVLPILEHRISTPENCIKHYYSVVEIKIFYRCPDKKTEIALGNDFDRYGRNIEHGLLYIKRSLCGFDSIKVIDGSSDTREISMAENNDVNYVLSKQEFADRSMVIKTCQIIMRSIGYLKLLKKSFKIQGEEKGKIILDFIE